MSKTIKLNHMTKIEGHANLHVVIDKNKVKKCELQAAEGSRYFEGILNGRKCDEAPEITARICGICSCAHTIASIQAVESAMGIKVTQQTKDLRELVMIGERIRSHATHLYFLSMPDYKGFDSAIQMLPKYKNDISKALQIVKLGNKLVQTVAGRTMHPVSAQVGAMQKLPKQEEIDDLRKEFQNILPIGLEVAKEFLSIKYPKFERKTEYFSLNDSENYPILYGNLYSESHQFKKEEYQEYLDEYHEPYATSNFVVKKGHAYMVGALPRLNNNFKYLSKGAKKLLATMKEKPPFHNPFYNNIAQAIELVHYLERTVELCRKLKVEHEEIPKVRYQAGHGIGVIEVPRGLLFHDYHINEDGIITKANIITPTCQNLLNIQEDVQMYIQQLLDQKKSEKKIIEEVEKLIRAYDPCFSCATHFLEVKWEEK